VGIRAQYDGNGWVTGRNMTEMGGIRAQYDGNGWVSGRNMTEMGGYQGAI